MLTRKDYRDAMARLGAAVNVITSDGPGGRRGFTATAVCSVTDDPPTLLVCMNRGSDSEPAFMENQVLCVNVLTAAQEFLSPLFAGFTEADMEARFAAVDWTALATGSPVLVGAAASFDCKVVSVTDVGTHHVMFCEVQAVAAEGAAEGLVYFSRGYHAVKAA
jgi:flavin reductase